MIDARRPSLDLYPDITKFSEYVIPPVRIPTYKPHRNYSKNLLNSFPKIEPKFLKKTFNQNSNESNRTINTDIHNNTGQSKSEEKDEDDDDEDKDENKLSKLFIHDKPSNNFYLLEFKATNVMVVPIYVKHRTYEENENDKCNQPRSASFYRTIYNCNAKRFNQLVKSFKIDNSKKDDRPSIMSSKKPLLKKRPVFPPDPKPKPSISGTVTNLKQSIIYITYKEVTYKIKPGLMNIRSSKPIDFEADEKRERLLKDLHMELPVDLKNKAQLIINYKGDILKITFTISEINYNKLKITNSVGIMVKDDSVYLREFSTISNRIIFIAVPKSSYEYKDGMMKQRQKNMLMKLRKIDPIWLVEQRSKRIKEYNQCRRKNPYDDIIELKIGSSLTYEGDNCLNKLKSGTLTCEVSDSEYEAWIETMAKSDLPSISENVNERFESTFKDGIPDWDLVMNSK